MKSLKVPFIQLCTEEKRKTLPDVLSGIERIFEGSRFILGEEVEKFESAFAAIAGCEYGVGVNSGLDALLLALRALEIGSGDEVITVPNSFVATAAAISLVGAKPVFVDVGRDYNLDPQTIERALTSRTKAILPVHLTGNPCLMDQIVELALKHNLYVIEDAAQAIGATYLSKPVGSWGHVGCFSLHPLKNLHVWGDGGMITTSDDKIAARLRLERNHGLKNRDEVEFFSYNSRLDTVQAVVGNAALKLLSNTTHQRIKHADNYRAALSGVAGVTMPPVSQDSFHVYHVFQITTDRRDEFRSFLEMRGVETKIHYPIPLHLQRAAAHLGYKQGDFPVTEELARTIVSLPVRENLTSTEQTHVINCVKGFFEKSAPVGRSSKRRPEATS